MSNQVTSSQCGAAQTAIHLNSALPLVEIPPGHVGPVVLPGSGRMIWWTGRVAVGALVAEPDDRRGERPARLSYQPPKDSNTGCASSACARLRVVEQRFEIHAALVIPLASS